MGLFSKILGKLGIGKKDEAPQTASAVLGAKPAVKPAAMPAAAPVVKPASFPGAPGPKPAPKEVESNRELSKPAAAPVAISEVDVVKKLEEMGKGKNLNWKVSIVDLLTLLEIDSGKASRIELAKELGCPEEYIGGDYSKMNTWLHKEVLRQIAANGGNIPKELLD